MYLASERNPYLGAIEMCDAEDIATCQGEVGTCYACKDVQCRRFALKILESEEWCNQHFYCRECANFSGSRFMGRCGGLMLHRKCDASA